MVNAFMLFIGGMVIGTLFIVIFFIVMHNKSFKNKTIIARQTGTDTNDVIWVPDKFRVKNKDGFWIIEFKGIKQKTASIAGSNWTKFVAPKYTKKAIGYNSDEWKSKDLSRLIQRGIFFYETSEGEFHPMSIDFVEGKGAKFNIISQDNKQFLINEIKDINSLTRNKNKELLLLAGIILACFILAIIFILGIIYLKESAQDSLGKSQQACIDYYNTVKNMSTLVGNNPNGQPNFLNSAVNSIQGGG